MTKLCVRSLLQKLDNQHHLYKLITYTETGFAFHQNIHAGYYKPNINVKLKWHQSEQSVCLMDAQFKYNYECMYMMFSLPSERHFCLRSYHAQTNWNNDRISKNYVLPI